MTLSAGATGLTSGNLNVTVGANAPIALSLSGSLYPVAGTCTTYTVTTLDTYGNSSVVGAATTVSLSQTGFGTFYSDSGYHTTATSRKCGHSDKVQQNLYFKSNTPGNITFNATASNFASPLVFPPS